MYRRILVASDYSAPATAGARLAASLAAPGASILAAHVIASVPTQAFAAPAVGLDPIPGFGWGQAARGGGILDTEDEGPARERLAKWVDETGLRNVQQVLLRGDVPSTLAREAESHAADLLVLGARGHGRLEEVIMGSTSREVLRQSKVDVLLAEAEPVRAVPPRRIAVAAALDETGRHAAQRALALAQALNAELVLLHAIGPGVQTGATYGLAPEHAPAREDPEWLERGVQEKMAEFNRAHLDGRARVVLGRGPMGEEVIRLAHESGADLLVVGHHDAGFFERLLMGSVSEKVARHPPCPTLFVKT